MFSADALITFAVDHTWTSKILRESWLFFPRLVSRTVVARRLFARSGSSTASRYSSTSIAYEIIALIGNSFK